MLNSCDFQGRFAADPELRTTQTGKQVASFRMAVDRDMVDANGHRPTDWLTFTAWGKTAEFVSKYFRKGSAAVVHSRCQTRQYEDKNGNNRTAIEFVVDNIYFAGPKQDNQQGTVDDGGTNPPPATYRNQQPQPQQMGFATQSQRQQCGQQHGEKTEYCFNGAAAYQGEPSHPKCFQNVFIKSYQMITNCISKRFGWEYYNK